MLALSGATDDCLEAICKPSSSIRTLPIASKHASISSHDSYEWVLRFRIVRISLSTVICVLIYIFCVKLQIINVFYFL